VKGSTERGKNSNNERSLQEKYGARKITVLNVVNSVFLPVLKIDHY